MWLGDGLGRRLGRPSYRFSDKAYDDLIVEIRLHEPDDALLESHFGVKKRALGGQRHFDARSPVFSAPKGPNIPAQGIAGIALGIDEGASLALKRAKQYVSSLNLFCPFRARGI